ncbi:Cupin 4 family protein [Kribbella flavida DSM 17836]|uniref:Cupin 4 family protein n=1 Tax=Kribbella flavida (strain DSM 17836 / JCM 10339 / NBRC 14399) TaxID=479435 RepID=D2PS17_KRIFD|nr:cupin domain-containing protein [Kribbella flavida]ADB29347.1 Cupin 4 family protein [Kribbella flavida DSM 17836]
MSAVPETGPQPDQRPALRRCVAGDPEEFASNYWGSRALLSPAAELAGGGGAPASEVSGFSDLFSLDAVDELLSRRGLRTPFLRIAKNGSVVGDNQFTGPGGVGAEIGDQVQDDKVAALFASGHTVVLQALHRTWPPLVDFATQLSSEAGHPVQINAYITPAESQGFSAHYDVHDVFVLQVAGEKHWTVHEPVHVDPLRNQPWTDHSKAVAEAASTEQPVVDAVLRPGDALYVPRGFLHSAKALGGVSAHLTVGLHTMTRYLLVQELAALAANVPDLRSALPLGFDPGDPHQLAPELEKVVALFAEHLQTATADDLTDRLRRRTWSGNRPAPLAPLAHAATIANLAVGDTLRLRPGLRHRLVPGDPVLLHLPDRTISFPANTAEAVTQACSGTPFAVGDLPGLSSEDQLVLTRRLLKEAVLVASPT